MTLWKIEFYGHYPVGAVAVMRGKSKEIALEYFKAHLAATEPGLVGKNKKLTIDDIKKVEFGVPGCEILLNGDY